MAWRAQPVHSHAPSTLCPVSWQSGPLFPCKQESSQFHLELQDLALSPALPPPWLGAGPAGWLTPVSVSLAVGKLSTVQ